MTTEQTVQKAGAFVIPEGVSYCVWAPENETVEVVLYQGENPVRTVPMRQAGGGFFEALDREGGAGDLYKFRLDGDEGKTFPDVASRFQPQGVHGPSQVMESGQYAWRHDEHWRTRALADLVIYEVHIGTFTPAGTYRSAIEKLDYLVALGITAVEIMPLADFPGRWNWGYDGVMLYAPSRAYGTPDDLRALIDAAHGKGLTMIIDAVYNHFGPDGAYFGAYTKGYFNPAHKTPWGDALNFDGPHHEATREFFVNNAIYWMEEFHFDGFRLDATHAIVDDSPRHVLADIAAAVHERGGFLFAEDERNDARLATPQSEEGGIGLDGMWADDFHHIVRVMLTGTQESYFENFAGSAGELTDTLEHGWFYRGQLTRHGGKERGTECIQLPTSAFCCCISNHDQVGNRAFGDRLNESCSPAAYRAASALLCLSPYTPLIFQGQEWAATTPFQFFTDHNEELGKLITQGRRKEFEGFRAFAEGHLNEQVPDPQDEATFQNSKLNWDEPASDTMPFAGVLALYQEALRLRCEEPALRCRGRGDWRIRALDEDLTALVYSCGETCEVCLVIFGLKGCASTSIGPIETAGPGSAHVTKFARLFSSNEARFGGDEPAEFDAETQTVTFHEPGLIVLKAVAEE